MRLQVITRALLCLAFVSALTIPAFAATPAAPTCQDLAATDLSVVDLAATLDTAIDAPTADALPMAYNCVWYGTEHCIDTHETTPCWTIRFNEPHCPVASGICVTNITYHTYDLYSCS